MLRNHQPQELFFDGLIVLDWLFQTACFTFNYEIANIWLCCFIALNGALISTTCHTAAEQYRRIYTT